MSKRTGRDEDSGAPAGKVRLQRVLAAAGIAARRAAEEMIEEGRVSVNGKVVTKLPVFVDPEADRIIVDGRPLPKGQRHIYIMVNKPERMLTVASDEAHLDRATILDIVDHPAAPRLFPVGRLEWNTAGLVLLTNDGRLANRLTHPRYGVEKIYRAIVKGRLEEAAVAELQHSLAKIIRKDDRLLQKARGLAPRDGEPIHPAQGSPAAPRPGRGARVEIQIEDRQSTLAQSDRTSLLITLREGRTGNIAKMLTSAGAGVRKLERIAIGPLELRNLARGRWRELERPEVHALKAAAKGERPKTAASSPPAKRRRRASPPSVDSRSRRPPAVARTPPARAPRPARPPGASRPPARPNPRGRPR